MAFKISVKGLDDALKEVRDTVSSVTTQGDMIIGISVEAMATQAKADAPVFDGQLRRGISHEKIEKLKHALVSEAPYSAYVNFGTKKKFQPVKGFENLYATGKGSGSFKDLLAKIREWVRKKRIVTGRGSGKSKADRINEAAWLIAIRIVRDGIPATFFYTSAIMRFRPKMIENLKKIKV